VFGVRVHQNVFELDIGVDVAPTVDVRKTVYHLSHDVLCLGFAHTVLPHFEVVE
jgi:hypothetical protein